MDSKMMAFCGAYCGVCEWKDKMNCNGCQECQSNVFWGQCDKAKCCIDKGFEHCGYCPEMPCQMLLELFNDPEHGDKGVRVSNLKNWANGKYEFKKLGNIAQEQAEKL